LTAPAGAAAAVAAAAAASGGGKHVMISYQWDSQKQALEIRDKLKAAGYNVWIDVDSMGTSYAVMPVHWDCDECHKGHSHN